MRENSRRAQKLTGDLWMSLTMLGRHPNSEQCQKKVKDTG